MKLFKRAGCGCTYIDLGDGTQVTVEYCGGREDGPDVFFAHSSKSILPENLVDTFISVEGHIRIFERINALLIKGDRFEDLKRVLGIKEGA